MAIPCYVLPSLLEWQSVETLRAAPKGACSYGEEKVQTTNINVDGSESCSGTKIRRGYPHVGSSPTTRTKTLKKESDSRWIG